MIQQVKSFQDNISNIYFSLLYFHLMNEKSSIIL